MERFPKIGTGTRGFLRGGEYGIFYLMKLVAGIIVIGGALLCGSWGGEVDVTLSDGTTLRMAEPPDMMGATWGAVGSNLPSAFLMVGEEGGDENSQLQQLMDTTRKLGSLFGRRYDQAVGATDEFADLYKVEQVLRDDREGKTDRQTHEAISKGEAVAFWSAMLSDYAEARGVARVSGRPSGTGLNPQLLNHYIQQMKREQDPDVYGEALRMAQRDNPAEFADFLGSVAPSDKQFVERVLD